MFVREGTPKKFAVGSMIRVKKGVIAPNCPKVPLGGWVGIVSQLSGSTCLIKWSMATLEAIPIIYRNLCKEAGVDIDAMWLQDVVLEGDPGEPLNIEE